MTSYAASTASFWEKYKPLNKLAELAGLQFKLSNYLMLLPRVHYRRMAIDAKGEGYAVCIKYVYVYVSMLLALKLDQLI